MPTRLSVSVSPRSQVRSPCPSVKPAMRGGLTIDSRRCCTSLSSVFRAVFAPSMSFGRPSCSFLVPRTKTRMPLVLTP